MVHKEDVQGKEEVVVYAKGIGEEPIAYRGTKWFKCLEHEVVGEVRRWEVAGDQEEVGGRERKWPLILNRRGSLRDKRKCTGIRSE